MRNSESNMTTEKVMNSHEVSYNLNRVFRNDAVLSNEAYTKALDEVKDIGIAYQGSKSYIRDTMTAIISSMGDIRKAFLLGEGSGAITASIPEDKSTEVYDLSHMTNALNGMKKGRIIPALFSAYKVVIAKMRRYLGNPSPELRKVIEKAISEEVKAYQKKHEGAEPDKVKLEEIKKSVEYKEAMRLVFAELLEGSESNFQAACSEMRESLKNTHSVEEIDARMLELSAGLALFVSYGSFRNAGTSFSYNDMNAFLKGVKAFRDTYKEHQDKGCTEFAYEYFFNGLCGAKKPSGYKRITRILKTELEIMRRDVTVHQEDFFSVLENGVLGEDDLIIADPPYPSENGNAYQHDDYSTVERNYELLIKLMKSGAKFIMFCDVNSMNVFEPVLGTLNFYALNPKRRDGVQDVIITNCELPCNLYSKLPEEFQKLAMVNFNRDSEFYGESDIEDLDATGFTYTPLIPIKEIMVSEVYRRLWHDMLQKAGFDSKVK